MNIEQNNESIVIAGDFNYPVTGLTDDRHEYV